MVFEEMPTRVALSVFGNEWWVQLGVSAGPRLDRIDRRGCCSDRHAREPVENRVKGVVDRGRIPAGIDKGSGALRRSLLKCCTVRTDADRVKIEILGARRAGKQVGVEHLGGNLRRPDRIVSVTGIAAAAGGAGGVRGSARPDAPPGG